MPRIEHIIRAINMERFHMVVADAAVLFAVLRDRLPLRSIEALLEPIKEPFVAVSAIWTPFPVAAHQVLLLLPYAALVYLLGLYVVLAV